MGLIKKESQYTIVSLFLLIVLAISWKSKKHFNLYPFIDNRIIVSKSPLSINFHTFRYFQITIRKLFPKLKGHDWRKLADTTAFLAPVLFMIQCRCKFLEVINAFANISYLLTLHRPHRLGYYNCL